MARGLRRRVEGSEPGDWAASGRAIEGAGAERAETKDRPLNFERLESAVESCRRCPLGSTRIKAVFGVGDIRARVMFIGEGPGFDEDHKGEPFVGRAGQLLDKILASIGLSRRTVYIANMVKCHPMKNPRTPEARSNDRPPAPDEIAACRPYLDAQIGLISPRAIVTLGAVAARAMTQSEEAISKIRGIWRDYAIASGKTVKLLPTFHPAALLRNPDLKKLVWEDMKSLRRELEESVVAGPSEDSKS